MIKIGYGKWTTPTQVTYTRRELYLFNKLGELTGTNESLFFEWLRYAAVFFPLAVVFAQSAVVSPLEWEVLYPILGKLQTRIELGCGVRANFR